MRVLLVEPDFPITTKSKNHKDFLPIGLLKIASYLRKEGCDVNLIRGTSTTDTDANIKNFVPEEIWVTSLFTYWAPFVKKTVNWYRSKFAGAKIRVGGIYASLFSRNEVKSYTGCDDVWQGVIPEAEMCEPAYDLVTNGEGLAIDYQIIHASRGCPRHCEFCGTWKVEPRFTYLSSVKSLVSKRKLVFYDNNFLMNPNVDNILFELSELKSLGKIIWCEAQSGFDGRILIHKPQLATELRKAGFRYPRIAWDWEFAQHETIKKQLEILVSAGYPRKDIFIFMLYNWKIPFEDMERKRAKCWEWGVQIADCRYRPLNIINDAYHSRKNSQPNNNYYIHREVGWADSFVRQFRKNVREQNICIRHGFPFYSPQMERKNISIDNMRKMKSLEGSRGKLAFAKQLRIDTWIPSDIRLPKQI